jgi:hypothetical protein
MTKTQKKRHKGVKNPPKTKKLSIEEKYKIEYNHYRIYGSF